MPSSKNEVKRSSYIIFFPLLFLMLILEILHLPAVIEPYRPDFTLLMLIYFIIKDPKRINIGIAWVAGLLLDLLTGAPLGMNALAVAVQVFIIFTSFKDFKAFGFFQQCVVIGIINILVHVAVYWLEHLLSQSNYSDNFFLASVATIVAWPIMYGFCSLIWVSTNSSSASEKPNDSN